MAMEYRYIKRAAPTVGDDGKLHGRAWPYGKRTQIGSGPYGFTEHIRRGAGRKSINDGDIVLLDNHETRLPLARMSAGSLTMADGPQGGDWEAQIVDTTYGNDVRKNVKAGNYGGCSFGFEVIREKWTMKDGSPATPLDGEIREILEMKVHEISVCTFPAYTDTLVSTKEQVRAARGMSPEQERFASMQIGDIMAMSPHGADVAGQESAADDDDEDDPADTSDKSPGEGKDGAFTAPNANGRSGRAAAATYTDLTTCGECGSTGQYDAYCTACGESMRSDKPSSEYCGACGAALQSGTRACAQCGTEVRADDKKAPYGDVAYADPGYQSDKKKRYPIDTKEHAKAAWSYISKAKNAGEYSATQLASIKSKIKAALSKFGVKVAAETNMDAWEALADFREMTEGWEPGDRGVLPGGVSRADDINALARDIKTAPDTEARLEIIQRATDFGVADMLPDHWNGVGGVGDAVNDEVRRDMDEIYTLAMSMPPTTTSLRILDLAQGYLTETAMKAAERAAEEPPAEEEFTGLTLAEARQRMKDAEDRRKALLDAS